MHSFSGLSGYPAAESKYGLKKAAAPLYTVFSPGLALGALAIGLETIRAMLSNGMDVIHTWAHVCACVRELFLERAPKAAPRDVSAGQRGWPGGVLGKMSALEQG